MPQITSDQAVTIAQQFSRIARAVEDYRFQHYNDLTMIAVTGLTNAEDHLRSASNDFLDVGINLVLDKAEASIAELKRVTDQMSKAIGALRDVQKALQLAGVALQIALAFTSENPVAIVASLHAAASLVDSLPG